MYRWNKKHINDLINYLSDINADHIEIKNDLEILKELKQSNYNILSYFFNLNNYLIHEDDYQNLLKYDDIKEKIFKKYSNFDLKKTYFTELKSNKNDILEFTKNNLYKIDKKIGKTLEPHIFNKDYINYNKNNENYVYHLLYLKKYYISLCKENSICDFFYPTHEFLHIYSTLLNEKSLDTIEVEFLSILGELITSYHMRKDNLFLEEVIKYDMYNFQSTISFLKYTKLKIKVIDEGIISKCRYNYLKDNYNIDRKVFNEMYSTTIEYDYNTFISYFLALELFNIYICDKEKCLYICENIIKSNDEFEKKLKDNNIELLINDNDYIKKLKKEYSTIDNL